MASVAATNVSQIGSTRKSFTTLTGTGRNSAKLLTLGDETAKSRTSLGSESSRSTSNMSTRSYENSRWVQRLKGSVFAICETENENKANKLNRTEECILEGTKDKVDKECALFERQHTQFINAFRAKSARLLRSRSEADNKSVNDAKNFRRSVSFVADSSNKKRLLNRRQISEPAKLSTCNTCAHVQGAIDVYEKEMEKTGSSFKGTNHSICLFSDRQMETFMHLLEKEYCSKMPNVTDLLHNSKDLFLTDASKTQQKQNGASTNTAIQQRVRMFCRNQETFNKQNPISSSIKHDVEDARRQQATTHRRDFLRTLMLR